MESDLHMKLENLAFSHGLPLRPEDGVLRTMLTLPPALISCFLSEGTSVANSKKDRSFCGGSNLPTGVAMTPEKKKSIKLPLELAMRRSLTFKNSASVLQRGM